MLNFYCKYFFKKSFLCPRFKSILNSILVKGPQKYLYNSFGHKFMQWSKCINWKNTKLITLKNLCFKIMLLLNALKYYTFRDRISDKIKFKYEFRLHSIWTLFKDYMYY
jgi:hypothetical protein